MSKLSLYRRMSDVVTMFVVAALSLLLLIYVGFAEGKRTYENLYIEKMIAQGRLVQGAIENYLRDGLPLNQYVGFASSVEPIVRTKDIDAIAFYGPAGGQLGIVVDRSNPALPQPSPLIYERRDEVGRDFKSTHYQVVLPLHSRFEVVGSLVLFVKKGIVEETLDASFRILVYGAILVSAAFALFVFLCAPYAWRSRTPWLQIGYAAMFIAMAGVVVVSLAQLYADGVRGKVQFSAETLKQRLSTVVEYKLRFADFDGVGKVFSEYRRLNPEISEVSLIVDGTVQISTASAKVGKPPVRESGMYEYAVKLSDTDVISRELAVSAPNSLVYEQIWRSVLNFGVLFVASGFLSGLFLQVATSAQRLRSAEPPERSSTSGVSADEAAFVVIKPVFFLAVFLEHMIYSFLPAYMQDAAIHSSLGASFATAPFIAYYFCFAAVLIPAGYVSDRYGPKPLICVGLLLASFSVLSLAVETSIGMLMVLRGLAGVGQAMLFIGIQSYILAVAPAAKKTQAAGIIVFGFQGGMIAGMAIGSLLVVYLQPFGVFVLSGAIGFATLLYSTLLIPSDWARKSEELDFVGSVSRIGADLMRVARNGEFMLTMLCVGAPAKAVLTGAVTFALPLLLAQQGYRQEEIGQIIMLYGIGVVAASSYVAQLVDRTGSTTNVLFWGASVSGVGLALIGLVGSARFGNAMLGTSIIMFGMVVVGVAHGCINAPVVTHVAQSRLADEIGPLPVTVSYRFLERVGHIAGPLLVGEIFILWGQSPHALAWIGFGVTALAFLFLIGATSWDRPAYRSEHAR